jgi:hypothetical protein
MYEGLQYIWDETKRASNLRIHGLDFRDAWEVFAGHTLTVEDDRFAYGERRFATIGFIQGRVVTVVHTEAGSVIRVISLRKATRHEEARFRRQIHD